MNKILATLPVGTHFRTDWSDTEGIVEHIGLGSVTVSVRGKSTGGKWERVTWSRATEVIPVSSGEGVPERRKRKRKLEKENEAIEHRLTYRDEPEKEVAARIEGKWMFIQDVEGTPKHWTRDKKGWIKLRTGTERQKDIERWFKNHRYKIEVKGK